MIGKYRNALGVELHVYELLIMRNLIGTVWKATIPDALFGEMEVLITEQGLKDSGYTPITE
jgi:hypothetical protein